MNKKKKKIVSEITISFALMIYEAKCSLGEEKKTEAKIKKKCIQYSVEALNLWSRYNFSRD